MIGQVPELSTWPKHAVHCSAIESVVDFCISMLCLETALIHKLQATRAHLASQRQAKLSLVVGVGCGSSRKS